MISAKFRFSSARRTLVLLGACLGLVGPARAATLVVTDAGDPGNGVCDSVCTLREAITQANGTAIADTINFAIPTPIKTEILIAPATALPTIIKPLTINGYSQTFTSVNTQAAGTNAKLRIRLDGVNVADGFYGLAVCSNAVTIKGLSITGFNGGGISYGKPNTGGQCVDPITSGTVSGNFIGLRSDGATAGGNDGTGVTIFDAVVSVGGSLAEARNVISANDQSGIRVIDPGSNGTSIQGNLIGTDRSAALDRGNVPTGIAVESFVGPVAIGDLSPNVIAYNIRGISMSSLGFGVSWYANHVFANDQIGLDLATIGITPNDPGGGDADTGANDQQNFPEILTASRVAGGLAITGRLEVSNSPLNPKGYRLAFYASASCDGSGNGEGERYLGSLTRALNTSNEGFTIPSFATTDPLPPGTVITATATDPNGSSSEFSACFALDPPPLVVNANADTDDGVCNAANCTLREAINAANARAGADVISFAIGTGLKVISPTTPLPTITDAVAIDGYTQPGTPHASPNTLIEGSDAVLLIRIEGAGAGASASGLGICASNSVVRGLSITGFKQSGIAVGRTNVGANCAGSSSGVIVAGNFIGLQPDGSAAGNVGNGVNVRQSEGAVVGGVGPTDRNVISANGGGVAVVDPAAGRQIKNNYIGTDPSGTLDRGNTSFGLILGEGANDVSVGLSEPNRIAYNNRGIGVSATAGAGNTLLGNAILLNDALGIDLGALGVTGNDTDDNDPGGNNGQNFPELTLAQRSGGGIKIEGSLDVPGGTTDVDYIVDVYANATCDPPFLHGEGERHLGGSKLKLSDGASGEEFSFDLATEDPLPIPTQVTATATGPDGSTSEFSACIAASDPSNDFVVTSAADTGGTTCGATCTLRQAINAANLALGGNQITFAIQSGGVQMISPATPLPTITDELTINGYSQPSASDNALEEGDDAVILVRLDGASAGTDADGLAICASETLVRGLSITGFDGFGVAVGLDNGGGACAVTPSSVNVSGNFIGLAPDGAAAGNGLAGVLVSNVAFTRIGGESPAERNVISSNGTNGVFIAGSAGARRIENNYIGLDPGGVADRGNAGAGVLLGQDANGVQLGFSAPNRIGFNSVGAQVSSVAGGGNNLQLNEYVSNDALGIDIGNGGVDTNDTDDDDLGANDGQNFPVITGVRTGPNGIEIDLTLDVPAANGQYIFAVYESANCDPSGHGEGEIRIASFLRLLSGGSESVTVGIKVPPPAAGRFITATATNPAGSTSEFSACFVVPVVESVFSDSFEEEDVPEI